jgi:hypothetical protein
MSEPDGHDAVEGDGVDPEPDPVATLVRWRDSGAVWRLLGRRNAEVTVGLYSCDGGEEMGRLRSSDPRLLSWVEEHGDGEQSR